MDRGHCPNWLRKSLARLLPSVNRVLIMSGIFHRAELLRFAKLA
jgi:hypothetical protein